MRDTTSTSRRAGPIPAVRSVALALALIAGIAGLAFAKRRPPDPTSLLDGQWQMDVEHSESLQERMRKAGPPAGNMGGYPGFMGGMSFGGSGGAGGLPTEPPPNDEERAAYAARIMRDPGLAALARPPLELQIEDANGLIVIRSRGETLKTLRLPPAKNTIVLQNPVLDAEWKRDKLEARGRGPHRGRLIETYELVEDNQTLVITTRVEDAEGLPNFDVERVYRRVTTR
jgi:hypothetical protein